MTIGLVIISFLHINMMDVKTTALLIIVVGYIAKFIIEASHDFIISNFEQDHDDNVAWHKLNWWYLFIESVMIASMFDLMTFDGSVNLVAILPPGKMILQFVGWSFQPLMIMMIISMLKVLVFNIRLNHLFKNDWWYLSKNGFEGNFKGVIMVRRIKIQKEKIYYLTALIIMIGATMAIF